MQSSYFLAQLIGPTLLVLGVGLVVNHDDYRIMAEEFLASRALIYLAGLLALVPGLAIVVKHNIWTLDWRLIITLLGWLAVLGGIFRILMPRQVQAIGKPMLEKEGWLRGGGIVVIVLGAILSFFGYTG